MGFFDKLNDAIASWADTNSAAYDENGKLTEDAIKAIKATVKYGQYDTHMDGVVNASHTRKQVAKALEVGAITAQEAEALNASVAAAREAEAEEAYRLRCEAEAGE